jgi:hypothetical protein
MLESGDNQIKKKMLESGDNQIKKKVWLASMKQQRHQWSEDSHPATAPSLSDFLNWMLF